MQFPNFAARVGSCGVEVAQAGVTQAVGIVVRLQRMLEEQLGNAVGIHWLARDGFVDGLSLRMPINRATRRENEFLDPARQAGIEQRKARFHIVSKILAGIGHRFADVGAGSEVKDSVGSVNGSRQPANVCDFALNYLEALDEPEVARGEVVVDQNVETILAESTRRMAPNIACTADYKNRHRIPRVGSGAGEEKEKQDQPSRKAMHWC